MAGIKLRDDEWQPLFDAPDARDWIFPIEALAFGDRDDDFTEWVDSDEKRAELIDELPRVGRISFRRLTSGLVERLEVIVRFLALLELFKQGYVDLEQTERFGDVEVVWTGDNADDLGSLPIDDYEG